MLSGKNWLTDYQIDFEYKKYVLLDYLKKVKSSFTLNKIYPHLSDLLDLKNEIMCIRRGLMDLNGKLELKGFSWNKLRLDYKKPIINSEVIEEIFKIIEYSLPLLEKGIDEGKAVSRIVENSLNIEPVGIIPVRNQEGYIFFHFSKNEDVYVYRFSDSGLYLEDESVKTIKINFIKKTNYNLLNSFEKIKSEMIECNKEIPNPAVFRIHSTLELPVEETFVPVGRRFFEKNIAA